jgi:hypothetical protein
MVEMNIRIRFTGGPLHGQRATTNRLPYAQVFTNSIRRTVVIYYRDELVFKYHHKHSRKLTKNYDAVAAWIVDGNGDGGGIPFVGDKDELD